MNKVSSFRPSLDVDIKQIIIITLTLLFFATVPFVVSYIQDPSKKPLGDVITETFQIETTTTFDDRLLVTLPIINKDLDLTLFKTNPQLIIFIGVILAIVAFLVGITLVRNLRRK